MPPTKIALLICDTPTLIIDEFGDYNKIFNILLTQSLPDNLKQNPEDVFIMDGYDVVNKRHYPTEEQLDEYACLLLTGSASTAWQTDVHPWIPQLVSYIKDVADRKPQIKIVGICFGHQIVAMAMGGTCVNNDKTWEVGPTDVVLTDVGKKVFGGRDTLHIQQMHQDHVPTLPTSPYPFQLLGSTSISLNQGMVLFSSQPPPGAEETKEYLERIRIITTQGHPEFHFGIMKMLVDARSRNGVLSPEVSRSATRRNNQEADGTWTNDGLLVGRVVWGILGIRDEV